MRDGLAAVASSCAGCRKPLRPGAQFCPSCGCTAAGSAAQAVPFSPPIEPHRPASVFDSQWRQIKQVGWLFALLLGSSLIAGIFGRFKPSPWLDVFVSSVDAFIVTVFAVIHHRDIRPLIGRPALDLRGVVTLTMCGLIFVAAMSVYYSLIKWAGFSIFRAAGIFEKAGWPVVSMFALISLLPALVEEVAFRGVIQSALQRVAGEREALLIQAALFSVLHLMPMMFISHFFMGLCFGYARVRSKSLYPGMVLHAAWNACVLCRELHYI
jgi:membrane protease YdiL (CAAX protease family)